MAKRIDKVVHVALKNAYKGKKNYYFGSVAAIYEELPENVVGIKLGSLWNVGLKEHIYSNNLCTIIMDDLIRKPKNTGKEQ